MTDDKASQLIRELTTVWADFHGRLLTVPIIKRVIDGQIRMDDYKNIMLNHRQQVIDGGRWIALTGSSIDHNYADLRCEFLKHAITEQNDYKMLEANYQSVGGSLEEIQNAEKNIGSEALSAFIFHRASQPNPFDLAGAMFIIEGLGQYFAKTFSECIQKTLELKDEQISFYTYHAVNDEDHLEELFEILRSGILDIEGLSKRIIKTAKITARLYLLQWEEIGNY